MSLHRFFKKVSTNKLDRSQSNGQIVQNGEQIRRTSSPKLMNISDGLPPLVPTGPKGSRTVPVIQDNNGMDLSNHPSSLGKAKSFPIAEEKSLPSAKENELPPTPDLYVNVSQDGISLARSLPPSPVEKGLSSGNDGQLLSSQEITGISVEPHSTRAEETG
jgi:hypothetical protein